MLAAALAQPIARNAFRQEVEVPARVSLALAHLFPPRPIAFLSRARAPPTPAPAPTPTPTPGEKSSRRPEGGSSYSHTLPQYTFSGHSAFFWMMMLSIPVSFAGLMGYYLKKGGYGRGAIRLPRGDSEPRYSSSSGVLDTLASVPWFLIGLAGIAYEWVADRVDGIATQLQGRRGYRNVPVDEDAQILRFEDEELGGRRRKRGSLYIHQ
ncbi:hypothetical protein LXA43DRAFT_1129553 [Ganoderma leucocontextum]|nr:hypothetical protein LXA43DRAFT_1129553 [Ganoderma leucocontextum]